MLTIIFKFCGMLLTTNKKITLCTSVHVFIKFLPVIKSIEMKFYSPEQV